MAYVFPAQGASLQVEGIVRERRRSSMLLPALVYWRITIMISRLFKLIDKLSYRWWEALRWAVLLVKGILRRRRTVTTRSTTS
jgi:hypothetical protein